MRKQSALNVLLLLLSIAGAIITFFFGEALLAYVAYLPLWVQCGVYLLFVMAMCCIVLVVSEKIKTGQYLLKHNKEFGLTAGKAALIFLPTALALGIITQLLYNWGGVSVISNPRFQGTMIVCDVSGSMLDNDPNMEAVEAMASYIDAVPLGEHLGIILFSDVFHSFREYAPMEDEDEREELKNRLYEEVFYSGGTDIEGALLKAIGEMRAVANPDWPGLVLLFSDGESHINYDRIRRAATGDQNNERNRIPVSTIYYSRSPFTGSHMSIIAQETGGQYFHVGVGGGDFELRDVFNHTRESFSWSFEHHLIRNNIGPESRTIIRIILRSLFLASWCALSGVFIVIFLNNNRLFKHFLVPKIIVSIVCGIAFTVIMLNNDTDAGARTARALLAAGMCVMYLPTYRWD